MSLAEFPQKIPRQVYYKPVYLRDDSRIQQWRIRVGWGREGNQWKVNYQVGFPPGKLGWILVVNSRKLYMSYLSYANCGARVIYPPVPNSHWLKTSSGGFWLPQNFWSSLPMGWARTKGLRTLQARVVHAYMRSQKVSMHRGSTQDTSGFWQHLLQANS